MNAWLDPQTKEILEPIPPTKRTGISLCDYCLSIIRISADYSFIERALKRIGADSSVSRIKRLLDVYPGVTVKTGLSYEGALMGQFELICADTHSVFLDSEVSSYSDPEYLRELIFRLSRSTEFAPATVELLELPRSNQGLRFEEQFFSPRNRPLNLPWTGRVARKKARVMEHWATKFSIPININIDPQDESEAP